jgi:hypothetical protein
MNKLFIGLLIVAAGAGIFYYFNQRTCNKPSQNSISKELLIGKWKAVAAQPAKDSAQPVVQYEFQKAGTVLRSLNDSAIADTLQYEWSIANELVWKETSAGSVEKKYAIVLLTKDSLQLQPNDSTTALFIKVK